MKSDQSLASGSTINQDLVVPKIEQKELARRQLALEMYGAEEKGLVIIVCWHGTESRARDATAHKERG